MKPSVSLVMPPSLNTADGEVAHHIVRGLALDQKGSGILPVEAGGSVM
jgi:hypothetical protein